jgi:hypothetical protein
MPPHLVSATTRIYSFAKQCQCLYLESVLFIRASFLSLHATLYTYFKSHQIVCHVNRFKHAKLISTCEMNIVIKIYVCTKSCIVVSVRTRILVIRGRIINYDFYGLVYC